MGLQALERFAVRREPERSINRSSAIRMFSGSSGSTSNHPGSRSELASRNPKPVVERGRQQDVDVLCGPKESVEPHRLTAHQDVMDAFGLKASQQVDQTYRQQASAAMSAVGGKAARSPRSPVLSRRAMVSCR